MGYFAPMSKNIEERRTIKYGAKRIFFDSETNGSFGVSSDSFSF